MSKEQELNEYLAELCGWEMYNGHPCKKGSFGDYPECKPADKNYLEKVYLHRFDPLNDLEQAFDVLEQYDRYFHMVNTTSDAVHDSSAEMKSDSGFVTHESNDPCELIVCCILKSESKFEEFEGVFNQ